MIHVISFNYNILTNHITTLTIITANLIQDDIMIPRIILNDHEMFVLCDVFVHIFQFVVVMWLSFLIL